MSDRKHNANKRAEYIKWINISSLNSLLCAIKMQIINRQGFSVATLNLDHIIKLNRFVEFRRAYANADFVTADGFPIVWAARLTGQQVERTAGSDLLVPLAKTMSEMGVGISLVGSTRESLAAACTRLREICPNLKIDFTCAPTRDFDPNSDEATAILSHLATTSTTLCFLALGAPKQEILAARGRKLAPRVGFVSVGAGIDFIAGAQKRAPSFMQILNLEWLWRLALNPRRLFVRYLECACIFPRLMTDALWVRYSKARQQ